MEALPYLLYFFALAAIVVVLVKMFGRKDEGVPTAEKADGEPCDTCAADPGTCLKERVIQNAVGEIEYFDDEELDRFRGRRADSYTADEASMFAEVMYTMKPEEVKDWLVSLGRRCVNLPDQLKDEAMMLMEG